MNLTLNGSPHPLSEGESLLSVVAAHVGRDIDTDGTPVGGGRLGVAVALNGEVVPRGRWAATTLPTDAQVDIVTAAQGG